jgi:hypothetical protein
MFHTRNFICDCETSQIKNFQFNGVLAFCVNAARTVGFLLSLKLLIAAIHVIQTREMFLLSKS